MIIALVVVAALIVGTYVYVANESLSGKPTGWVGRAAPDFTLQSANGFGSFTLSSERHHQNVLLFFNEGLTCSPCLGQMQQLDSDVAKFQAQHVLVVSITGDSSSELGSWTSNSDVNATPVLGDPSLTVCNEYDTTGASVSMMPGSAPGHTFILVNETGVVVWRADYGPSDMSVPDATILGAVQAALTP